MPTIHLSGEQYDQLEGLGNVNGSVPSRRISPFFHLSTRGLILKLYQLFESPHGEEVPLSKKGRGPDAWLKAEEDVKKGRLNPLSGLGFAVSSSDVFNVCRWNNDPRCLDVVVPSIYVFDGSDWVRTPVEEAGAFCGVEKAVYDHEYEAWMKYLHSRRELGDKVLYTDNFLDGQVV